MIAHTSVATDCDGVLAQLVLCNGTEQAITPVLPTIKEAAAVAYRLSGQPGPDCVNYKAFITLLHT